MTTDYEHLLWIYGRLLFKHKENPRVDYMVRMKEILERLKKEEENEK